MPTVTSPSLPIRISPRPGCGMPLLRSDTFLTTVRRCRTLCQVRGSVQAYPLGH